MEAYAENYRLKAAIQMLVITLEKKDHTRWRQFSIPSGQVLGKCKWYAIYQLQFKISILQEYQMVPHLSKNGQMSSLSGCFTCRAI
ncbi:hypothetical protein PAHAL_6G234500 [Panicum hallii]|uniref:Uncharacterized protein n=1 Tax=Panicum hallii TaxID=206008 RepID=A0A2T8IHH3_9POAL|nr:hypothetical protein PAHAL_6G234500 [Panicum hallii]